ncbi:uncharacterized protein LOC128242282 [Mya arenaria]|uniref:uncharacterized protein LOC128242282 n=1 Tax=Mya arenaria TaxID=6604 RepID=UPI0022E1291F|nr:uncharacterized protein LOC128242282 [Mya arenaria]XP_052815335.1 uncharacterized protein LOC128242282 [Mya arenaria]
MGLEINFRASHVATQVGAVVLLVTFLLYVVGFATNGWAYSKTGSIKKGLWKICLCSNGSFGSKTCICTDLIEKDDIDLPDWYKAVRACAVIAFLFLIWTMGCTMMSMFITLKPSIRLASIAFAIFAGAFILTAIVLFRVKLFEGGGDDIYDLQYSYYLCTTVVVIIFVILIPLLVVGHIKTQSNLAAVGIAHQGFVISAPGHTAPSYGQQGMAYPMMSYPTEHGYTGVMYPMSSHPVGYGHQGLPYPITSYPAGYGRHGVLNPITSHPPEYGNHGDANTAI